MTESGSGYVTREECQRMIAEAVEDAMNRIARAPRPMKILGLEGSKNYAEKVAAHLGMELTPTTEKCFEDGECYAKPTSQPEGNVRGHNIFIIQSLFCDDEEDVSQKFMKMCVMAGACKQASAHEVTVLVPHLAWARQDRKTESRAPITTQIVARMIEGVGVDRAVFFDAHNLSAEQNAFRIPTDNLEIKNLAADWCAERLDISRPIVAESPDAGGFGRADRFRTALVRKLREIHSKPIEVGIAIFDKLRRLNGVVSGGRIVGDVSGAQVILVDDIISTAGTMQKAAKCTERNGGELFALCATHGLFVGNANDHLRKIDAPIVVGDTIEPFRLSEQNREKLHILDTTEMAASAIQRIHTGYGSISELLT